jgi:hypothetical protein
LADELIAVLSNIVAEQVTRRPYHALERKTLADTGVAKAREYLQAMLGLQVLVPQAVPGAARISSRRRARS